MAEPDKQKRKGPVHQPQGNPPADPGQFHEAIKAFRKRVPMTDDEFDELDEQQRERAFTVAGLMQADLVGEVYEAIDDAIEHGETLDDFKARVGDMLSEQWGGEDPPRLEMVFRTNVNSAYNAGRYAVFSAPAVKEARPYFRFEVIDDDRLDDECGDLAGTVLPQDDSFWDDHVPPLHPNCRCSFSAVSAEEAGENDDAIDTEAPDAEDAAEGFGGRPDRGDDWQPDLDRFPSAISDVLREVLAG